MSKKPFTGYQGQEEGFWRRHHRRYPDSILAVGRGNASPKVNEEEYAKAGNLFRDLVTRHTDPAERRSVLDLGFGQCHYAKICQDLGFRRYLGIDFASTHRIECPGFEFRQADISDKIHGSGGFDLVVCIDVIFHVVRDDRFDAALENMANQVRRPGGVLMITSLFRDQEFEPYVKHRSLSSYRKLRAQKIDGPIPWRDNAITCWRSV